MIGTWTVGDIHRPKEMGKIAMEAIPQWPNFGFLLPRRRMDQLVEIASVATIQHVIDQISIESQVLCLRTMRPIQTISQCHRRALEQFAEANEVRVLPFLLFLQSVDAASRRAESLAQELSLEFYPSRQERIAVHEFGNRLDDAPLTISDEIHTPAPACMSA